MAHISSADPAQFKGRVVIVTGGASGIGAEEASAFAALGAHVVITDLDVDGGTALADQLGETATFLPHDVSAEASWNEVVSRVEKDHGRIDVLINNAGVNRPSEPLHELSPEHFDWMYRVNQRGVFLGMRAVAPLMRSARSGSIINTASVVALRPRAGDIAYVATKFAVRGMTKVAAAELGPFNVRVNAMCPGPVETPMMAVNSEEWFASVIARVPLRRIGQVSDVAQLAVFLASDAASYITGADFPVDGGLAL